MKLKKIVSLALAGILAVSMLTACGDKGSSSSNGSTEVTPTGTYTATVLNDTAYAKLVMTAEQNSKLDSAVAFAAANYAPNTKYNDLTFFTKNSDMANACAKYMGDAVYANNDLAINSYPAGGSDMPLKAGDKDATYYALYTVKRAFNDEMIDDLVSDLLDSIAKQQVGDLEDAVGNTRSYSVSVAKADCEAAKGDPTTNNDYVIVGVAVTLDYTKAEY